MNILSNYPNIVSNFIFPIFIALFTMAFPLLLQSISKIDEKYKSTILVKLFKDTLTYKWYYKCFIIAIFVSIIWCLQLSPIIRFKIVLINNIIGYSALILILVITLMLIAITFMIVKLIATYYDPMDLSKWAINKYNKTHKDKYFEAVSILLFYFIQKSEEKMIRILFDFYSEAFYQIRKGKKNQIIDYPQMYYDVVFGANELLCIRERKTISNLKDSVLLELFLDESQQTIIGNNTYHFMWRCLCQILLYDRDEYFIAYWERAHQYLNSFIPPISPLYTDGCVSKDEISKYESEKETFLEFHYALGGLVMYLKKYKLLSEMMSWTSQKPPKYILVPERMEEVITRYMNVSEKGGYRNPIYYEQKYPFPNISGVNSDDIIQMWIKKYISVLFLRQYTLKSYFIYDTPLTMPTQPAGLSEQKRWNEELKSLNDLVQDNKSNEELLSAINMRYLSDDAWYKKHHVKKPSALIKEYIEQIYKTTEKSMINNEIDLDKIKSFNNATIKILKEVFDSYSSIYQKDDIGGKSFYLNGMLQIFDKRAFSNNSDISYANADTILAEGIASNFKNTALNAFFHMKSKKFVLKKKDILPAIDALKLDPSFIIVSIGIPLYEFPEITKSKSSTDTYPETYYYKEIKILDIPNNMNDLVRQSFFILEKKNLPSIQFNDVIEKMKKKYTLKQLDKTYNIYTNILDLNKETNEEIKKEASKAAPDKNLSQCVLACIAINVKVSYKTDIKCIQLRLFDQFEDKGVINTLEDVHKRKSIINNEKCNE